MRKDKGCLYRQHRGEPCGTDCLMGSWEVSSFAHGQAVGAEAERDRIIAWLLAPRVRNEYSDAIAIAAALTLGKHLLEGR